MRRLLLSTASGVFLLAGAAPILAQDVVIAPEQETVIREYVTTHQVQPVEIPDLEVSVGATIPDTVELHTMDVPDVQYRYVVVDDRTVLVDPGTRQVVHIVE